MLSDLFSPFGTHIRTAGCVANLPIPAFSFTHNVKSLEEALGYHMSYLNSRTRLADQVEVLLAAKKCGRQLTTSLSQWLLNREDSKKCEESLASVDQWLEREGAFDADIKAVKMASALLPKLSLWTVAGDGWGNGSDTPGLHNFLACGADTNVMLLATDPSRDDASIPTTGTPPPP